MLEDVTLRHYAKDGTLRTGHADELTYHRKAGRLEAEKIEVDIPPTAAMGREGARIEAGRGEADLKGNGALASGGVHIRTGIGDVGHTEAATWDATTEVLEGSDPVAVQGPGYEARADGFRFQLPGQRLELKGDVRILSEPEAMRASAETPPEVVQ